MRKNKFMRNKKGTIQDLVFALIVILVLGLGILFAFKLSDEFNTRVQAGSLGDVPVPQEAQDAMNKVHNLYPTLVDNMFLFMTVAMAIAAFILAALVRVHPIFLVFYLFVLAVLIFLAAIFSNIYQTVATNPEFTALAQQLELTNAVMAVLPFFVGIFGSILAIVMYKTWRINSI